MWKDAEVGRPSLWANVISNNRRKLRKPKPSAPSTPVADVEKLEKKVVALLHAGDTKKAIQQLIAAPIAPNTPQTFKALQPSTLLHLPLSLGLTRLSAHLLSPQLFPKNW